MHYFQNGPDHLFINRICYIYLISITSSIRCVAVYLSLLSKLQIKKIMNMVKILTVDIITANMLFANFNTTQAWYYLQDIDVFLDPFFYLECFQTWLVVITWSNICDLFLKAIVSLPIRTLWEYGVLGHGRNDCTQFCTYSVC